MTIYPSRNRGSASSAWRVVTVAILLVAAILIVPALVTRNEAVETLVAATFPASQATDATVLPQRNGEHRIATVNIGTRAVSILHGPSGITVQTYNLPISASDPVRILGDHVDQRAYVVCRAGEVFIVDADAQSISMAFQAAGLQLSQASIDANDRILALDIPNNQLWSFNTANSTSSNVSTPTNPTTVGVSPSGETVALVTSSPSTYSGTVHFLDGLNLGNTISAVSVADGGSAIDFSNGRAYLAINPVADFSRVEIIDPASGLVTGLIAVEWGGISLDCGFDSLVIHAVNSDSAVLYDTFPNSDEPRLVGTKSCVTGAATGGGGAVPPTGGGGGKKPPTPCCCPDCSPGEGDGGGTPPPGTPPAEPGADPERGAGYPMTVVFNSYPATAEPLEGPVEILDGADFPPLDGGPPMVDSRGETPPTFDLHAAGTLGCDPIDYATGAFYLDYSIVEIAARGIPFDLRLDYNSRSDYDGPFGKGFQHSYDQKLYNHGGSLVLHGRNHRAVEFSFNASSGAYESAIPQHGSIIEAADINNNRYYIRTDPTGSNWRYNQDGWLVRVEDRLGNALDLWYQCGKLTRIENDLNHWVGFSYHDSGRVASVSDHSGRNWQFGYDSQGRLISIVLPTGHIDTFDYLQTTDPVLENNITEWYRFDTVPYLQNSYDIVDRVISQVVDGKTATLSYGQIAGEATTEVYDQDGGHSAWVFDSATGELKRQYVYTLGLRPGEPASYLTSYEYDATAQLTKKTLPSGRVEEYVYDTLGNLVVQRVRESDGSPSYQEETWAYAGAFNQVSAHVDYGGRLTTYTYDALGLLTRIDHPDLDLPTPTPTFETFEYNSYGQLTKHIDEEGHQTVLVYGASGSNEGKMIQRKIRYATGSNDIYSYGWDWLGRQLSETDPAGRATYFAYDDNDQMISVTRGNGIKTTYEWDPRGNMTREVIDNKKADGAVSDTSNPTIEIDYEYDGADNLSKVTEEVAPGVFAVTLFEYTVSGKLLSKTDANGSVALIELDERHLPWRITEGYGTTEASTKTIDYDADANVVRVVDALGHETLFTYDASGLLSSKLIPTGAMEIYTWTSDHQLAQVESWDTKATPGNANDDELLSFESYSYTSHGRVRQSQEALHDVGGALQFATTTSEYDRLGNLIARTAPNGAVTSFQYDGRGRCTSVFDDQGNEVLYVFQAGDMIRQEVYENIQGTPTLTSKFRYNYDGLGNIAEIRHKDLNNPGAGDRVRLREWDSRGRLLSETNENGNQTTFTYDGLGRLLTDVRGSGSSAFTTTRSYDPGGRLTSIAGPSAELTSYAYNARNLITSITYPGSASESFTWDLNNNLSSFTDRNGSVVTNVYGPGNVLTARTINRAQGVLGTANESFTTDALGRITSAWCDAGGAGGQSISRAYDLAGRITSESTNGRTVQSSYGVARYRTGRDVLGALATNYQYDSLNRLTAISRGSSNPTAVVNAAYSGVVQVGSLTFGNGAQASYAHDQFLRTTGIDHKISGSTFAGRTYDYDPVGNQKSAKDLATGLYDVYSHDSLERTTAVVRESTTAALPSPQFLGTKAWNFDQEGNFSSIDWTPSGGSTSTTNFSVGSENRYTAMDATTLVYDANGNLTDDGSRLFAYDYANRLVEVREKATSNLIARYEYGPLGRRLRKEVFGANALVENYAYDHEHLVQILNDAGSVKANFVHLDRIDQLVHGEINGGDYFYHIDNQGTVLALTDAVGALVEQYSYDPYGEVTIKDGQGAVLSSSAVGNHFLYQGRYFDEETELYHFRNRTYSPTFGRFLQLDPSGFADGINRYGFVAGRPLVFTDPYGLWSWSGTKSWFKEKAQKVGRGITNTAKKVAEVAEKVIDHPVTQVVIAGAQGLVTGGPAGAVLAGLLEAGAQLLETYGDSVLQVIGDALIDIGIDAALVMSVLSTIDNVELLIDGLRALRNPAKIKDFLKELASRKKKTPKKPDLDAPKGRGGNLHTPGSGGSGGGRNKKGGTGAETPTPEPGHSGPGTPKPPTPNCFVAGTLVACVIGLMPIENVAVGQRVLTSEARIEATAEADPAGQEDRYRKIRLRSIDEPGIEFTVLRERRREFGDELEVGDVVPLDWSGEDYDCRAEVVSIEPCPRIEEGPGHVVTATMHGRKSQILRLDLGTETIGTTPGHPFWSIDRAAWIEAGKLRTGERLQALGGEILVVRGLELGSVEVVFNLEVNGAHHFAVGGVGVLAHNHCFKFDEEFDNPADAIGDLNGTAKRAGNVERTKDPALLAGGYTETHYFRDTDGVKHTVFHNPSNGRWGGAHPSSGQDT